MRANPLLGPLAGPSRITIERLEQMATDFNREHFARCLNRHYFVNRRDGGEKGIIHFLDWKKA